MYEVKTEHSAKFVVLPLCSPHETELETYTPHRIGKYDATGCEVVVYHDAERGLNVFKLDAVWWGTECSLKELRGLRGVTLLAPAHDCFVEVYGYHVPVLEVNVITNQTHSFYYSVYGPLDVIKALQYNHRYFLKQSFPDKLAYVEDRRGFKTIRFRSRNVPVYRVADSDLLFMEPSQLPELVREYEHIY